MSESSAAILVLPDDDAGAKPCKGRAAFCFLLPLLLVVPFDPQWLDFERARRAVLMILVGVGLLLPWLRNRSLPPKELWPLYCIAVLSELSVVWARDRLVALEHGGYLLALALATQLMPRKTTNRTFLIRGFAVAVVLSSIYGIAQCLGLVFPDPYTVTHEPVSSLGNTNVAAEWTAVAAPLALLLPLASALPTVLLAATYLWANGGTAALLGLHAAMLVVLALPRAWSEASRGQLSQPIARRRQRLLLAGALLIAPIVGLPIHPSPPPPEQSAQVEHVDQDVGRGGTTTVRLRLYPAVLHMTLAHMPFGTGVGNFAVEFPRYRDVEEIEVSSQGGRFLTRAATAHSDPLQILAELGLLGGACLVLFLVWIVQSLLTRRLGVLGLASLAAFLPVTLFRSALWNAPAAFAWMAALTLALMASERDRARTTNENEHPGTAHSGEGTADDHERAGLGDPRERARRRAKLQRSSIGIPGWILTIVGLPLIVLGLSFLFGEWHGARFLRAQNRKDLPSVINELGSAVKIDPAATKWRLFRSRILRRNTEEIARILRVNASVQQAWRTSDLQSILRRQPGDLDALLEVAWLGLEHPRGSDLRARGKRSVELFRGMDPVNHNGIYLESRYAFREDNWRKGLELLEELALEEPILAQLRETRALLQKAEGDAKLELAILAAKLKKLGAKLFPQSEEFRR